MSSNAYLKISTMQYPLHQGDIRLMYPDIGEEFVIPDSDIVEVEETPIPNYGPNDFFTESLPVLIDGKWVRQFSVRPMTADEIAEREKIKELIASLNKPPVNEVAP